MAAIQATSENGRLGRNLENGERIVQQAVSRGATLVLGPEFPATGYVYDESIWDSAEPVGGPTEAWLARVSERHGVFLGASFLEVEGDDFYNTFSLFGPDGRLAGRARKSSLPFFEGWYFRACQKPKVIETSLGRIAVGICNDNQTAGFLRQVAELAPDMILMPHSAPTPAFPVVGRFVRSDRG